MPVLSHSISNSALRYGGSFSYEPRRSGMLYLERYQGQRKGDDMMKSAHKLPTLSLGVYILLSTTSGLAQAVVPAPSHAVEDLLLQRLDALEARVRQLEARNAVLEAAQAAMPAASAPFAASPVAASLASSSASSPGIGGRGGSDTRRRSSACACACRCRFHVPAQGDVSG